MKKIEFLIIIINIIVFSYASCEGCNTIFNNCSQSIEDFTYCNENDINILNDIIEQNNLNQEWIDLGYQQWENSRLKSLILINNNIFQLPQSIGNLDYLEGLDLEFNYLQALPNSFGNLFNLKYLDLSSNNIDFLPDNFFNLENLLTLGLYNNDLQLIQNDIGLLSNLQFINLSYNQLASIPDEICNLQNVNWSDTWINLNFSYIYNNNICPPYPICVESYIGNQDVSDCETECLDNLEGDLNYDYIVNVLDVVTLVNCILFDNRCDLCFDINYDNEVNVVDIIGLVNIILDI